MNEESRTDKSLKNMSVGMLMLILANISNFVYRALFLRFLTVEYLGVTSLLSGVIALLSLTELGFGTAIVYFLYKPFGIDKDETKVAAIVQFLKRVYTIMAAITLVLGLSLYPFLDFFVKETVNITPSLKTAYLFYVANAMFSYVGTHKTVLFMADQKDYVNKIHVYGGKIAFQILAITLLAITKQYLVVLISELFVVAMQNLIITLYANKKYPFLKNKVPPLSKDEKKEMTKLTGAFFVNKLGSVVLTSTDNIIISAMISIVVAGLYSNYYMIICALNSILAIIYNAVMASIGNYVLKETRESSYKMYKTCNLLGSGLSGAASIGLYLLSASFISFWVGDAFVLDNSIVLAMTAMYYLESLARTNEVFLLPMGLTQKTVVWGIIYVVVNLIVSIILAPILGLVGIFLGTICARIISFLAVSIIVNKDFQVPYYKYILQIGYYFLLTALAFGISYFAVKFVIQIKVLDFIVKAFIVLAIFGVIYFVGTFRTAPFEKIKQIAASKLGRRKQV